MFFAAMSANFKKIFQDRRVDGKRIVRVNVAGV